MKHIFTLAALLLQWSPLMLTAAPVSKAGDYQLHDSRNVQEVQPEARKETLLEFAQQPRQSVLYQSLPGFGQVVHEIVVEVESPVLYLTKPDDVNEKRRQVAERRTAEEALERNV